MSLQDLYTCFWSLEEASGNRADEKGGMTLSDNNSAVSATGKVGNGVDLESGSTQFLSRNSEATLQMGDIACFFSAWVKLESTGDRTVFGKYNFTANSREYVLFHSNTSNRFQFTVSSNGNGNTDLTLSSSGAISAGVWYFVVVCHDPTANKIYGCVNNGTVDEIAHAGGIFQGSSTFALGHLGDASFPALMDGIIDQAGFGKNTFPSASEITQLYNNGDGLSWAAMGAASSTGAQLPNINPIQTIKPLSGMRAA